MDAATPLLVALLPSPRDLDLAREAGWYRIPAAHAPPALAGVRALAFYQPASFGARRWRIEWWAAVRTVVPTTRAALLPTEPDHPRAAEPYLRVDLGPLHPLDPPLVNQDGRRLLFLPTTWGRLTAAAALSDLRAPQPIADDPLYLLIQSQLDEDARAIPDPGSSHQPRLLREGTIVFYEALPDW